MNYETYFRLTSDDAFCHAPSEIKHVIKYQGPSKPCVEAPRQYRADIKCF